MIKEYGIESKISQANREYFLSLLSQLNMFEGAIYYGYPVFIQDSQKNTLKGVIVCNKGIFIFYDNEIELESYKRYIVGLIMSSTQLSQDYFDRKLFIDDYKIGEDISAVKDNLLALEENMTPISIREFNKIFQKCNGLNAIDKRDTKSNTSLGSIIKKRSEQINNYDEIQFRALYENNFQNVRIRGLAGSGKTILLVKKMAYLHFQMPHLKMAYVFYTKSLQQYITDMFVRFYKDFDPYGEPLWENIKIVYCWGNRKNDGFYTLLCKEIDVVPQTYSKFIGLEDICKDLLAHEQIHKLRIFDFVFIDEAQDFGLQFFKLTKAALKSTGKLIYAYDELQTLDYVQHKMPSKEEIFNKAETCIDIGLAKCYRTPLEILVTAHAIGLGVYRKNILGQHEFSTFIQDKSLWKDIGYEIECGELNYGKDVVLYREKIFDCPISDAVTIQETKDLNDEFEKTIQEIERLCTQEDVLPDDIIIIDLDSINLSDDFLQFREMLYSHFNNDNENNENAERPYDTNLVNKDHAFNFRIPGSIAYTTIYRAKGNEANIVFVLNCHKMDVLERYRRNRLFTAMTRAKMKVYLFGDNKMQSIISECAEVKANDYKLKFKYPTKKEIDVYKGKMIEESRNVQGVKDAIELAKQFRDDDPSKLIALLCEQTGKTTVDDLIQYINEIKNKHD